MPHSRLLVAACRCARRLGALAVCVLLLSTTGNLQAGGPETIVLGAPERQPIRTPAEFLVSPEPLDFDTVRTLEFQPLTEQDLNQGISDYQFWIRMRLANPSDEVRRWILHHETPYIDNISVYHRTGGSGEYQVQHLSDRQPYATRLVDYRKLAFPHTTAPGAVTDLYLRISYDKADTVSLNFVLWDAEAFLGRVQRENLVHGMYFGAMACFAIFALFAATVLRQRVYLDYAIFILLSALMWAMLQGFTYQYLWPRSVFLHNEGFHIAFLLVAIAAMQFSKAFLHTDVIQPAIHRLLQLLQILFGAGILARLAGAYEPVLYLSYASLCVLILLPLAGYLAWRKGLSYARWYALAWAVYGVGLIMSVLSASTSLLDWGMQPLLYAQAASLLEAMLLLVALGERLLAWDRDRKAALLMAQHDPLTGLGNRRLLAHAWRMLRNRQARNQEPIFLLLLDVDHFKRINDRYGHAAGDEVLRNLSGLLLEQCRADDICVRYGGEEFAVLFQAPNEKQAVEFAERLRSQCEATPTRHDDVTIFTTLSAGVAQAPPDWVAQDYDQLIQQADAALYYSKSQGRNCTTLYTPDLIDPAAQPGPAVENLLT